MGEPLLVALLDFLSHIGVIALLFRVGLESEVSALWDQLGRAWPVWLGSITVSGVLGYGAARIYGGAILVTLVTCLVFPVVARWLLERWPEAKGGPA